MKKRNIYILALGGTIASKTKDNLGQLYSCSSIEIKELIQHVKENFKYIHIQYEQIFQKISHEITNEELLFFANRLNELIQRFDIDGLVVLMGTNVMEEVAYFISLVIKTEKTIVFTGASRPYGSYGYDGIRNLHNSISLAGSSKISKLGVVLTFNDAIVAARDAIKMDPCVLDDFSVFGKKLTGNIMGENIYINRFITTRHTCDSEFDIKDIQFFHKVCIICGHLGMDNVFIETAISNKYTGIISAGMGKGYQPKEINAALESAIQHGVYVVRCSRTGLGNVSVSEEWEGKKGFIAGGSLTPQKARTLLMVALSKTNDPKEIQRIFNQY